MNTLNLIGRTPRTNCFEATVAPTTPFRGDARNALERLKLQLLAAQERRSPESEVTPLLCRAAEEAAALVWLTPYPLLLLPALLEEKAQTARATAARQATIRHQSSDLLSLVE